LIVEPARGLPLAAVRMRRPALRRPRSASFSKAASMSSALIAAISFSPITSTHQASRDRLA
jgi:hypothetical protein